MTEHVPLHVMFMGRTFVKLDESRRMTTLADYERFLENHGMRKAAAFDHFDLGLKPEMSRDGRVTSVLVSCKGSTRDSRCKCGQPLLRVHTDGSVTSLLTPDERVLLHERHIETSHGRTGPTPHFLVMAYNYGILDTPQTGLGYRHAATAVERKRARRDEGGDDEGGSDDGS